MVATDDRSSEKLHPASNGSWADRTRAPESDGVRVTVDGLKKALFPNLSLVDQG